MNKLLALAVGVNLSIGSLFLVGCATQHSSGASVSSSAVQQHLQPVYYTVQVGDSLSAIAAQYHMNYLTLARENNLSPPYSIRTGQKLLIGMAAANTNPVLPSLHTAAATTSDSSVHPLSAPTKLEGQALNLSQYGATTGKIYVQGKSLPLPPPTAAELPARTLASQLVQQANEAPSLVKAKEAPSKNALSTKLMADNDLNASSIETSTTTIRLCDGISWSWPVVGVVVSDFSKNEGLAAKGIEIEVKPKSTVLAAAEGSVLYSGLGAKAYGNMIIIKHKNNFLTAYANLSKLLVKQGQEVSAHERIAVSGTINGASRLHFEVRRFGSPVDPLNYMPSIVNADTDSKFK